MSATIKYTYLKQQTWLYRRNYPRDLQELLGAQALKQSLKTGDAKLAKARSAEVNAKYEEIVRKARQGVVAVPERQPEPVRVAPAVFSTTGPLIGRDKVAALARLYLKQAVRRVAPRRLQVGAVLDQPAGLALRSMAVGGSRSTASGEIRYSSMTRLPLRWTLTGSMSPS